MKAKTVNEYLKSICKRKDLDLVEHQNIDVAKHLIGSALHLNRINYFFNAKYTGTRISFKG